MCVSAGLELAQREEALGDRQLRDRVYKLRVDDLDRVKFGIGVSIDQHRRQRADVVGAGLIGEIGELGMGLQRAAEHPHPDPPDGDQGAVRFGVFRGQLAGPLKRYPGDVGVERSHQPAVGGERHQRGPTGGVGRPHQGVGADQVGVGRRKPGHHAANRVGVGLAAPHRLLGLEHLGSGNQLHGPGDLTGGFNPVDAGADVAQAGHRALP